MARTTISGLRSRTTWHRVRTVLSRGFGDGLGGVASSSFRDFVLTPARSVRVLPDAPLREESIAHDVQWSHEVGTDLVRHPNVPPGTTR